MISIFECVAFWHLKICMQGWSGCFGFVRCCGTSFLSLSLSLWRQCICGVWIWAATGLLLDCLLQPTYFTPLCIRWLRLPKPRLLKSSLLFYRSGDLVGRDTWMSDQDLDRLIGAIDRLTLSTDNLRQAFQDSQPGSESATASSVPALESGASGSLVRDNTLVIQIEELSHLPFPSQFSDFCVYNRFNGLEEGPCPVPAFVWDYCRERLSTKPPGISARVESAFGAGFWSRIAIDTETTYRPREPLQFTTKRHWVVLRSSFEDSFRTITWRDVGKICDPDDPKVIVEAFESLAEVEVYCLGAASPVPSLRSCSRTSSSA